MEKSLASCCEAQAVDRKEAAAVSVAGLRQRHAASSACASARPADAASKVMLLILDRTAAMAGRVTLLCSLLLLLLVAGDVAGEAENVCSTCPVGGSAEHRLYGTKTTYSDSLLHIHPWSNATIPASCQPVMFYMFQRHAIRYPDGEDIPEMDQMLQDFRDQIVAAADSGKSGLCSQAIDQLRSWRLNMKPDDDNLVTASGVAETGDIGMQI